MSIRAFIAIPISPEVITSLRNKITSYKKEIPDSMVRWIPEINIHLTLKFLGEVSPGIVKSVAEEIGKQISDYSYFYFQLDRLGSFPNLHHPQVIWIGGKSSEELSIIQKNIELITRKYGILPEDRPFSPHFTIGRVARNINEYDRLLIRTFLEKNGALNLEPMWAREITIIKSDLQQSGAVYTELYKFPLIKGSTSDNNGS